MSEAVRGSTSPPLHTDPTFGGADRRGRALTVALVVIIVTLVILSVVLVVLYTVPMKKVEWIDASWFGTDLATTGTQPSMAAYVFSPGFFCAPSNAIGNLTISLVWESSFANTTAFFFWLSPAPPTLITHEIYWVNNTSQGGYSFPPALSTFLCQDSDPIICHWYTAEPGAAITLTGVREYNNTATVPLW